MTTSPNPVTVWTKPSCPQCEATKKRLTKRGIDYIERNLITELTPEHLASLSDRAGYTIRSAPIIETPTGDVWNGFRPDRIDKYAARIAHRPPHDTRPSPEPHTTMPSTSPTPSPHL